MSDSDYELRAILAGCRYRLCPGPPLSFKRVRPGQMGTNYTAMLDGAEALWRKAQGMLKDASHLEAVAHNLARVRFFRAFRAEAMTRIEALAKCRQARLTCPAAVPLAAYVAAMIVIALPGGRFLARSPRVRAWRRAAARAFSYRIAA